MAIVPRNQAFDSELESGAHTTLILIATGLAFLFTATAIIFYLFPLCRAIRRKLSPHPPVDDDPSQVQELINKKRVFQPSMTSTPLRQMHALPQRLNQPSCQPEIGTISTQRYPAFFATRMPTYPTPLVPRPNASTVSHNQGVSPPIHIHPNHYYRSHFALAVLPPPLPITVVSPHIAGWMKIADDCVGPHPFAKPLFERVASQAEIDLISDHVQIGWIDNARRSQPTPVTALGPAHDAKERVFSTSRGRFPNRFEEPSYFPGNDSTARPEYKAVVLNDHPRKRG